MMKSLRHLIAATAVALCIASAHATTMIAVNLGQILEFTESAFVGRTVSIQTVQTPKGWADEVTMTITEPLHGKIATGETITWRQARHSQDVRFPGMPTYAPGAEYLIFLSGKGEGTEFQAPYGLGQGAFTVQRTSEREALVRNQFLNSHLYEGIDLDALATAAVAADPATRALTGTPRTQAIAQKKQSFSPVGGGASSLASLRDATRAFKSQPNPAQAFAITTTSTTTTKRLIRAN